MTLARSRTSGSIFVTTRHLFVTKIVAIWSWMRGVGNPGEKKTSIQFGVKVDQQRR
jgi:hypothetical protein